MTHFTESTIEQAAIDWLASLGYSYAFGPDLAFDGSAPDRPLAASLGFVRQGPAPADFAFRTGKSVVG